MDTVQKQTFSLPRFRYLNGQVLDVAVGYETHGQLNEQRDNAILICHYWTGTSHAAGRYTQDDPLPGWWDACIGPGKPIDTRQFFVVSLNNLGGCHGSTGPLTTNPATGQAWGPDFPTVTVSDWVRSQQLLADHLGITRFAAVVGGSLGGMQAMQWAIDAPQRLGAAVLIASAARLSAQNIAFTATMSSHEGVRSARETKTCSHSSTRLPQRASPDDTTRSPLGSSK